MRPREKQMFVIPAHFISCFPLFFFICYWKSWNEQQPTVITFNTYINYYSTFSLGDTFLHVRLTGVTFKKWTVYCILIPIDVSFYIMHSLYWVAWISSDYFESLLLPQLLRGENDSKQSDEFQAIYWDISYNGHHILLKTYLNNQICVLS